MSEGEGSRTHRVFVLGAGASVHAGYPLTRELGVKLMDWAEMNCPPNALYWPEREELAKFGSFDDIEELIASIEQANEPGPILAALREAVCRFFDVIRVNEAKLYEQFCTEISRSGDVVISFNYDVSFERELRRAGKWEISDGYGFDLAISNVPKSPVKLLKLHGSTNWMDSLFEGDLGFGQVNMSQGARGLRPVILPQEFRFLEYPDHVTDSKFKGGGMDRAGSMILPSRRKAFHVDTSLGREREDFWNSLWAQAAGALQNAQEIIVVGYSCPEADERARQLLFEQSNKNCSLTICCGAQTLSLSGEFAAHGFERQHIKMDWPFFEDFVGAYDRTLV